jgi:hypothetical protein
MPEGRPVRLLWSYPTQAISTDVTFVIHQGTNLTDAVTNWPVVAMANAALWYSNGWTANLDTNAGGLGPNFYAFDVRFNVLPGIYYWYCTASNYWESAPSNVVTSPPPTVTITNLLLKRP